MAEKSTPTPAPKAVEVQPGEPEEVPALSQMGGTFAERQAARLKSEKQVAKDTGGVEDKAVKKATGKAKKKS